MTSTLSRTGLTATSVQVDQAREVVSQLPTPAQSTAIRITSPNATIEVSAELADLLERIIRELAQGRTVTLASMPEEVTTTVAARELGMSRPTLMKEIATGALPARKVGTHTRIRSSDLLAFKRARLERQRESLEELMQLSDELGEI